MLFPLLSTAIVIGVVIAVTRSFDRLAISGRFPQVALMYRKLVRWRIVGLIVGTLSAVIAPSIWILAIGFDDLAPLTIGVPSGFAIGYLACIALGERNAYTPVAEKRTATLNPRLTARYVSAPLSALTLASAAVTTIVAVTLLRFTNPRGMFIFSCDGQTPGDNVISWEARAGVRETLHSSSAGMTLAYIVVVALVAACAVLTSVKRPRPDVDLLASEEDDALRRATIRSALGMLLACLASVGSACTLAIATILNYPAPACAAPTWWSAVGTALQWSQLAWAALFVAGAALLASRPTTTRRTASIG
ncbi:MULTISPECIES: hypothetical protein [Tsukamurella]|uniref:Uncharacterized protein n=2 Tax=Tsukamurella TaxID=2060 RepID=A0A5C5S5K7_9ACTN|nr:MULTISPECIES: hypothetical protein [Tsukamurella]NMD57416.1 hypothetical protein [Tsukamurella columbiensis]TWS29933.1 hypothetical protein FK530_05225 [Tsukamurella conjunctivitidis]